MYKVARSAYTDCANAAQATETGSLLCMRASARMFFPPFYHKMIISPIFSLDDPFVNLMFCSFASASKVIYELGNVFRILILYIFS